MENLNENKVQAAIIALNKNRKKLQSLDRYGDGILSGAQKAGKLRHVEGKDLRQEAMMRICREDWDSEFEADTQEVIEKKIYKICYWTIKDIRGEMKRRKLKPVTGIVPDQSVDPYVEIDRNSDREKIFDFTASDPSLKDDQLLNQLLKYIFAGFSIKEASAQLGISETSGYHKIRKFKETAKKYFRRGSL